MSTTRMRKPPDLLHIRAENRAGKQVMSPSYFHNYGNLATITAENIDHRADDVSLIFVTTWESWHGISELGIR